MATVTRTVTWSDNQVLTASALNGEFNNLLNALALVNADISASAAIAYSKLALTGAITDADLAGSISASKITNTAVTLSDTQTITNKTLTGVKATITAASDGATITFDLSLGPIHTVTLGGNRTLALSNSSAGKVFVVRLLQDGTGSRTVTWFSTIKWAGGSAPTLTTTASKADAFGFICTSTDNYDGFIIGQNL